MAGLCRTSLTATAIRYAELTDDPVALVLGTGGRINYYRASESMKSLRDLAWLRRGFPLPLNTFSAALNGVPTGSREATAQRGLMIVIKGDLQLFAPRPERNTADGEELSCG
jgi:hypothetical protein